MSSQWFLASPANLLAVVLSALGMYGAVIILSRLNGLRSFTKMSSFDFAMTVATGAVIGSSITAQEPPLVQGALALASLFGLQYLVALLRRAGVSVVDNKPVLLMDGPDILEENLRRSRLTRQDLHMNLRQAGVTNFEDVRAVVLEKNGAVSVLFVKEVPLEPELLNGVRRA